MDREKANSNDVMYILFSKKELKELFGQVRLPAVIVIKMYRFLLCLLGGNNTTDSARFSPETPQRLRQSHSESVWPDIVVSGIC